MSTVSQPLHQLRPAGVPGNEEEKKQPLGDSINYYKHIAGVLFGSFFFIAFALISLQSKWVQVYLITTFNATAVLLLELYFWAALGAAVASYKHFANDKEINEVERLKKKPDPKILRYPNVLDVMLYIQRIIFSGVLGVIGGIIIMAGLGYFEVQLSLISDKQRMFFVAFSFIVGIYQNEFLGFLKDMNNKLLFKKESSTSGKTGG